MLDEIFDHEEVKATSIPVHLTGTDIERVEAAQFGAWNRYPVSTQAVQLLQRNPSRDRAELWLCTAPTGVQAVVLNSNLGACQQQIGGVMVVLGQKIVVEDQQPLFAMLINLDGTAATGSLIVSTLDETWQSNK